MLIDQTWVYPLEAWSDVRDLRISNLLGSLPPIERAEQLEVLAVYSNQLPIDSLYAVLQTVNSSKSLRFLDLSDNCAVFVQQPLRVNSWPAALVYLNLSSNNFNFFNITPLLRCAPCLETLLLNNNFLRELHYTHDTPVHSALMCLSCDNNRFGRVPAVLYKQVLFPALKRLSLRYNQIDELLNLRHYTNLEALDLTCNKIRLDYNRLEENLPLATLKWLTLADNFIFGITSHMPLSLHYVGVSAESELYTEIIPHVYIGRHHCNYAMLQVWNITHVLQLLQSPVVDTVFYKQLGIDVHALPCRALCSDFERWLPGTLQHCLGWYKNRHANILVCCNEERKFATAFVCLILLMLGDATTYADAMRKVSAKIAVPEDTELQDCINRCYQLHQQRLSSRCALV